MRVHACLSAGFRCHCGRAACADLSLQEDTEVLRVFTRQPGMRCFCICGFFSSLTPAGFHFRSVMPGSSLFCRTTTVAARTGRRRLLAVSKYGPSSHRIHHALRNHAFRFFGTADFSSSRLTVPITLVTFTFFLTFPTSPVRSSLVRPLAHSYAVQTTHSFHSSPSLARASLHDRAPQLGVRCFPAASPPAFFNGTVWYGLVECAVRVRRQVCNSRCPSCAGCPRECSCQCGAKTRCACDRCKSWSTLPIRTCLAHASAGSCRHRRCRRSSCPNRRYYHNICRHRRC